MPNEPDDADLGGMVWSPEDARRIRELIVQYSRSLSDPPPPPPKAGFDFTINVQTLVVALIVAGVTVGGWALSSILGYQGFKTDYDNLKTQIQNELTHTSTEVAALNDQLNILRQSVLQIREQLSDLQKANSIHDQQQDQIISELRTEIAVLKERVDQQRAPGPKGELSIMPKFAEQPSSFPLPAQP